MGIERLGTHDLGVRNWGIPFKRQIAKTKIQFVRPKIYAAELIKTARADTEGVHALQRRKSHERCEDLLTDQELGAARGIGQSRVLQGPEPQKSQ